MPIDNTKTDQVLASEAGLEPGNFSKYLSGKREPTLGTIDKMAKGWQVSTAEVVQFIYQRRNRFRQRKKA